MLHSWKEGKYYYRERGRGYYNTNLIPAVGRGCDHARHIQTQQVQSNQHYQILPQMFHSLMNDCGPTHSQHKPNHIGPDHIFLKDQINALVLKHYLMII